MKYAIYRGDQWLEDIHADNDNEALELAKSQHGQDVSVKLVSASDLVGKNG